MKSALAHMGGISTKINLLGWMRFSTVGVDKGWLELKNSDLEIYAEITPSVILELKQLNMKIACKQKAMPMKTLEAILDVLKGNYGSPLADMFCA
ncbi:MAG: hypothetical protein MZU95_04425 [Desulfomicrobium escambiense]|nr:hypothetical protein [Desulfomicrobium escambiense]